MTYGENHLRDRAENVGVEELTLHIPFMLNPDEVEAPIGDAIGETVMSWRDISALKTPRRALPH